MPGEGSSTTAATRFPLRSLSVFRSSRSRRTMTAAPSERLESGAASDTMLASSWSELGALKARKAAGATTRSTFFAATDFSSDSAERKCTEKRYSGSRQAR